MTKAGFDMDLKPLRSGFGGLSEAVPDIAERQMKLACADLEGAIKARSPVDTGNLRASYRSRVERDGTTVRGFVGTNVPYAVYQEYGTGHQGGTPHVRPAIDARRGDLVRILGAETLSQAIRHVR